MRLPKEDERTAQHCAECGINLKPKDIVSWSGELYCRDCARILKTLPEG